MSDSPVDQLREQLRTLGYLSRGVERWFALDPWSSRTFWSELLTVAAKSATVLAPFFVLPPLSVMLLRNSLGGRQSTLIALLYLLVGGLIVFATVAVAGLALKLRPGIAIDSSRALLTFAIAGASVPLILLTFWWRGFDLPPSAAEMLAGVALLFLLFLTAVVVLSAAFLAFSIHELRRIPSIHRRSRALPITIAGAILLAFLLVPTFAAERIPKTEEPRQVVIEPRGTRLALVAVDGMTAELLAARKDLLDLVPYRATGNALSEPSPAERWATVGTGTPGTIHGVRSIDGILLAGSHTPLQSVSRADFPLVTLATTAHLARRVALPPAVRRRHYVWEIVGGRGVPSAAVNWWVAGESRSPLLRSISQDALLREVSAQARRPDELALEIDGRARAVFDETTGAPTRFASVYLPALDIVLNRLDLDAAARLTLSVRLLDSLTTSVARLKAQGFEVLLVGLPGEQQRGAFVLASTVPLAEGPATPFDVAPTLLDLAGFPASEEMPGRSLVPGSHQPRVSSYGTRGQDSSAAPPSEEYYESLRSLGYVR